MRTLITTLILAAPFLAITGESAASSPSPLLELCSSVERACDYASELAPVYAAEICWDGMVATPVGPKDCGTQRRLWLDFGELDPASGIVQGLIPLPNACAADVCLDKLPPSDPGPQEMPICCTASDNCVTDLLCGGHLYWCDSGVSNEDGTISCFEGYLVL